MQNNNKSAFKGKKYILLFSLLVVSAYLFLSPSLGEENNQTTIIQESDTEDILAGEAIKDAAEQRKKEKLKQIEKQYEEYISRIEDRYEDEILEKRQKISELQQNIESGLLDFDAQKKISETSAEKMIESNTSAKTLQGELDIFTEDINALEKRIAIMTDRIALKEGQISLLSGEKANVQKAKELQEKMVLDYFQLYQTADEEFIDDQELKRSLELLFTESSPADNIQEIAGLEEVDRYSREMFYLLDSTTSRLYEANKVIQEENEKILDLKERLEEEREVMREQKFAQRELLLQTENSEIKYQKMLQSSLNEMRQASEDIQSLQEENSTLNEELKELERKKRFEQQIITKERIREKMLEQISDENKELSVDELGKLFAFESNEFAPLQWPVEPTRGISAYFHDEKYKQRFGQEHDAIDIPVPQGSDVKSATAGYVYKAVDNGKGFSYIVILHRDNIRTMYGHISKIMVEEGQMVQEGEVIGLSGGTPGTDGAGTLTTGPHLHFQVTEGNNPQNPLEYLSLSALE